MPELPQSEARQSAPARALIADDERLMREQLQSRLAQVWPELQICAMARDGLEAVNLAARLQPDVVFLDIRMPGLTGIEAAREIVAQEGWHGEIVFVTAYDEYAVTAFERGALDYLLKPVEAARLEQTVARLKRAMHASVRSVHPQHAKRTPLVISAATGKGVPEALRALLGVIDGARTTDGQPAAEPAWQA